MAELLESKELRNRNGFFADREVAGRELIVVDDGLASGYTMRAAVAYLRKETRVQLRRRFPPVRPGP